jgi:hypothetical protein
MELLLSHLDLGHVTGEKVVCLFHQWGLGSDSSRAIGKGLPLQVGKRLKKVR